MKTIRSKLILYFGVTVFLLVSGIIAMFFHSMFDRLIKDADRIIKTQTEEVAKEIEANNLETVTIAKTMALAQESGLFGNREASLQYARRVLVRNPQLTGAYFGYEPNADQNDQAYLEAHPAERQGLGKDGRFLPYWFYDWKNKGQIRLHPLIDMETSLYYQGCKDKYLSGFEEKYMVTEPYFYEGKMIVEQTYPIEIDGKFMGIAGVDRALTDIQTHLEGLKPYQTVAFILISRKGRVISSTLALASQKTYDKVLEGISDQVQIDRKMLTRNIDETDYKDIFQIFHLRRGEPVVITWADPLNGDMYVFSAAKIPTGDWTVIMRVAEREIQTPIRRTLIRVAALSLIGLLLTFLVLNWLAVKISKPVAYADAVAERVAGGDFTAKVEGGASDETGHLLSSIKIMTENLNSLVGQVQRSGIQVTSSSTEIAAMSREQQATMLNQLESATSVRKSVQEIAHLATDLLDTMQQVASISQETAGFASIGQTDLTRLGQAMRNMQEASRSISARLQAINVKAENITHVVTTIAKVADQTNLLSLNASIEAERAGEYGRGFSVVAMEIRRLADQTAVATLDIEHVVKEMQSAVSSGVMEMDKFITEVKRSAEDVAGISKQLSQIIERVQALSPRFEEVTLAMGRQNKNAAEIQAAMTALSDELHQTMKALHETNAAIEQLNETSRSLQQEVSKFKVS